MIPLHVRSNFYILRGLWRGKNGSREKRQGNPMSKTKQKGKKNKMKMEIRSAEECHSDILVMTPIVGRKNRQ